MPDLTTWLARWDLVLEGRPFFTATSSLIPVRQHDMRAMLKITVDPDEIRGIRLLDHWQGEGAVDLLAHEQGTCLMARARNSRGLIDLAQNGKDDTACDIICEVATQLHIPRPDPPDLLPLSVWFEALRRTKDTSALLLQCHRTAQLLLDTTKDQVMLHGDLHHGNILDFGDAGWRAIDPKGLRGDRAFEFAPLFLNPDLADPAVIIATDPSLFAQRAREISAKARLDQTRLVSWVLAFAGLSASWSIATGHTPSSALKVAALAAGWLRR